MRHCLKSFFKNIAFYFALLKIVHIFAVPNNAEIAQLVEHNLAKVGVAGPSPVFRSFLSLFVFIQGKQFFSNEFIFKILRQGDIGQHC